MMPTAPLASTVTCRTLPYIAHTLRVSVRTSSKYFVPFLKHSVPLLPLLLLAGENMCRSCRVRDPEISIGCTLGVTCVSAFGAGG